MYPLGLRAKTKGAQVHKRLLMKPQAPTYFIQVRLPAALQREMTEFQQSQLAQLQQQQEPGSSAVLGHQRTGSSSPSTASLHPAEREVKGGFQAAHMPNFEADELLSGSYATAFRGVVTVTIPSGASCREAIEHVLALAHVREGGRPACDYQLVQCFADFTPDHTRRRLTGDSSATPIKTVMQFPFHVALMVSPFVVLREKLRDEDEPGERAQLVEDYRKVFLVFVQGYQQLLHRLIEQSNFLRGREEEGRRGKKMEEREQFFELARFRALKQEKDERTWLEQQQEVKQRGLLRVAHVALRQKIQWLDGATSEWLQEHRAHVDSALASFHTLRLQLAFRNKVCSRFELLCQWRVNEAAAVSNHKGHLYTLSRIASRLDESLHADAPVEVVEAARREAAHRLFPEFYGADAVSMVANSRAVLDDVHCSSHV